MKGKSRVPAENNVEQPPFTPFIDIIFQILIFFMLSMKLKITEGYMMSHLPEKPTASTAGSNKEAVRVFVCADGNIGSHKGNKSGHEDELDKAGGFGDITVQVDDESGSKEVLSRQPEKSWSLSKYKENRSKAQTIANKAADLLKALPGDPERKHIKLDIDSKVPAEIAVMMLDALKGAQIKNIQQVPNPKYPGE